MEMKKSAIIAATMATALLAVGSLSGCSKTGSSGGGSSGKVSITLFNSKGEISKSLEKVAKAFSSANPNITITVSTLSSSGTVDETMMTKYASGNPYTMSIVDPIQVTTYGSKSMDLSDQPWVKNVSSSFTEGLKNDGKVVAFPFAVEGDGLIYNKTTIEKATGKTFDPASIKSLADLETLYKQIQAGGVTPVQISHEDWSLASHFLATSFMTEDTKNTDYFKELKAGTKSIADNVGYNDLIDLFNLNMKYNIYKSSPMSSDYNTSDPQNIATGKVAFWFNGVWVMPNVSQFLTGDHANDVFGFLPLFAGTNTKDCINATTTKVILVDKEKSTEAQRTAACKFLDWLANDTAGQKALVDDMGLIPAFTNFKDAPNNGLAKSIIQYMNDGKTIQFPTTAGDYQTTVGASMQQYLAGKIDKAALSKSIDSYFKSASWVK